MKKRDPLHERYGAFSGNVLHLLEAEGSPGVKQPTEVDRLKLKQGTEAILLKKRQGDEMLHARQRELEKKSREDAQKLSTSGSKSK